MKRLQLIFAPAALLACASLAFVQSAGAQGSDNCATPTVASGGTTFAFNNATATTGAEGQGSSNCNQFGTTAVQRDVWFTWVGPTTGTYTLQVCGMTSVDTKMAIYSGAVCPTGQALACNDDSCGLQSSLTFSSVAGSSYMIQIGVFQNSAGGSGTFSITAGGSPCAVSTGPDVIVGNVTDVGNTTAANGLDAISLGTDACNIGSAVLSWQANNNLHPVIGSTLYRYKVVNGAGRFEELGMSWLKHAFAAGSGSTCCSCQGGGGGGLGVGCSDVYGSGLNGNQSSAGPRWQVNAHTGVYTYPPANPPWSGQQARRCEVALTDLESTTTTATKFFGETTYVNQDDAMAGNGDNNASYVGLTCTGGPNDFTFGLTGATQRSMQALRAWPTVEPGVTLTDVHVPNDGLFVVGSHATSLGGGVWHYEYAVLNMNSARNGGSFTVALPAGATVTNVGFHDVSYHDGDGPGNVNYSGTDWPATVGASSVTWSTETPAQNASANAIRWSSTYNFRFDADVAPTSGTVTLGLWDTGSPASVTAAAEVPTAGNTPFVFCAGDGSGTACPCGNNSASGSNAGCLNSLGTAGQLSSTGTASVSADTFHLVGSNMPAMSTVLYFQGTIEVNGGAGATFGDGLSCAGGTTVRLGQKTNAGGSSQYPTFADLAISVKGSDAAGDARTYQAWYRNMGAFCTSDTFNLTNGIGVTWLP